MARIAVRRSRQKRFEPRGQLEAAREVTSQHAEAVDIVSRGGLGPCELLGTCRPLDASTSERDDGALTLEKTGDAEVENVGLAGVIEQDVGRLEVAVDEALAMGVGERVGDGDEGRQDLFEGAPAQAAEALAFDVGQGDEARLLGVMEVVNGNDVGMDELSRVPALAAKKRELWLGRIAVSVAYDLDDDAVFELAVFR